MSTTAYEYETAMLRLPELIAELVEERRRKGIDRFDEVWEGVLHMVPPPAESHGSILVGLSAKLAPVAERLGGRLVIGPGLRPPGSGDKNYRAPDLVYLGPGEERLINEGWIDGGPSVVFEVRSPRDETYEKLPFYAMLGVREVVVIERDTRRPEVFRLAGKSYVAVAADPEGRVPVEALRVRLAAREVDGRPVLFLYDDAAGGEPIKVY